MKRFLLIILLVSFWSYSKSQVIYQKISNYIYGLETIEAPSGDLIIAGCGYDSVSTFGLIRLNSNGDTIWERSFKGPYEEDGSASVIIANDNNLIIAGGIGTGLMSDWDVSLAKVNNAGNILWLKAYGGLYSHNAYSVKETNELGFIMAGKKDYGASYDDICLVKTDSTGNMIWNKVVSGPDNDIVYGVELTHDNGYLFYGSTGSFGAGYTDALLLKYDSAGVLVWNKTYGLSFYDEARSLKRTPDNGFIIGGSCTISGPISKNAFLIKINSFGDTIWAKHYNYAMGMSINSVTLTSDGGYAMTGNYTEASSIIHVFLLKTDSLGNVQWARRYATTNTIIADIGLKLIETSDNGFFITAQTGSPAMSSGFLYAIKTDSIGNSGCVDSLLNIIQSDFHPAINIPSFTETSPLTTYVPAIIQGHLIDSIYTVCSGTISINEIPNEESFSIYPNPANEIVTISTREFENSSIRIFDLTGKLMMSEKLNQAEKQINIAKLPSGMYFVQIQNGNKFFGKKFVKE